MIHKPAYRTGRQASSKLGVTSITSKKQINFNEMKIAGIILLILGIIGVIIFGIQAMNDSESFNFLGLDIAVSKANWTPLIVSGVIAIVGGILTGMGKKA